MAEPWTDDRLREFVFSVVDYDWDEETPKPQYEEFVAAALIQLAPVVQETIRIKTGAGTSLRGISAYARTLIEIHSSVREKHWLVVTDEPWNFLTAWVTSKLLKAHRRAVKVIESQD